jgi:DNA-binding NtrC family response regulator
VVQIKLPLLRERKSDIPLLVTSFLEKFSRQDEMTRELAEDAMRRLMAYDWPGNVRELENTIERAVALGSGPCVHLTELPTTLQYHTTERAPQRLKKRRRYHPTHDGGHDRRYKQQDQ